jgi:hypothetical protein
MLAIELDCKLVEDQNGGVVLIGGLTSSNDLLINLYQLPNGGCCLDHDRTEIEN